MGVPEKLAKQATKLLGEPVLAAATVVPPGSMLYRGFSPSSSHAAPLMQAYLSKRDGATKEGMAATVPTSTGVLVVTAGRVVFCKKKLLGVGVSIPMVEWPRPGISFLFDENDKWSYPSLLVSFPDESSCVLYGHRGWGLEGIDAVMNR